MVRRPRFLRRPALGLAACLAIVGWCWPGGGRALAAESPLDQAATLRAAGRFDEALEVLRAESRDIKRTEGDESPKLLAVNDLAAEVLIDLGSLDTAGTLLDKTIAARQKLIAAGRREESALLGGSLLARARLETAAKRLPAAVDLIHCVRHPYDVLTSVHPLSAHLRPFHVTRDRWFAEWDAIRRLRRRQPGRRIVTVRYEDLVTRPDDVQATIAADLGLVTEHPFSANPLGVEIRPSSLEKWRTRPDLRRHLAGLDAAWHAEIGRFCTAYGYATGGLD